MTFFQTLPLELGCEITRRIRNPRSLRFFRESFNEAQEIVDSCVYKINGPVTADDLLALPSVSEIEGTVRLFGLWEGSGSIWGDVLRRIRGPISIEAPIPIKSLEIILKTIYIRKNLYPESLVEFRDGNRLLAWDGSRGSLAIVYPMDSTSYLEKGVDQSLARPTGAIRELTYYGLWRDFTEFWGSINPLRLRVVTMSSVVSPDDTFQQYLRNSSRRFQLRISTFRLEPSGQTRVDRISDNWRSGAIYGVWAIFSSPRSTRYLQELYGLAVPVSLDPADLRTVTHALRDLKIIVGPKPEKVLTRPPIPYSSLTPVQQERAQPFLDAFPEIPITFH